MSSGFHLLTGDAIMQLGHNSNIRVAIISWSEAFLCPVRNGTFQASVAKLESAVARGRPRIRGAVLDSTTYVMALHLLVVKI